MRNNSLRNALIEPTHRAHLDPETYKLAGFRKKVTNAIASGMSPVVHMHAETKVLFFQIRLKTQQMPASIFA